MTTIESTSLYFQQGASDKVYNVMLLEADGLFAVGFAYGRRGSSLKLGTKITDAPRDQAQKVYDRLVAEKTGEGYKHSGEPLQATTPPPDAATAPTDRPVELLTDIEQDEAIRLANDDRYWLQEKRDGRRLQIRKNAAGITGLNRRGLPVALSKAVLEACERINLSSFLFDGEGEGDLFVAFDLLEANGLDLSDKPYGYRFEALKSVLPLSADVLRAVDTWTDTTGKLTAMRDLTARAEGVVFKLRSAAYRPGRNGSHFKFKFVKTLSAVVCALREDGKNSAEIAVFDEFREISKAGGWVPVGKVSLNGKPDVRIGDIVEAKYLYCTAGHRLYQPGFVMVRDDLDGTKAHEHCTARQMKYKQGVDATQK